MAAPAEPDRQAVAAFWADFCAVTGTSGEPVDVVVFGDSAELLFEHFELVRPRLAEEPGPSDGR